MPPLARDLGSCVAMVGIARERATAREVPGEVRRLEENADKSGKDAHGESAGHRLGIGAGESYPPVRPPGRQAGGLDDLRALAAESIKSRVRHEGPKSPPPGQAPVGRF